MVEKKKPKKLLFFLIGIVVLIVITIGSYFYMLSPVNSGDKKDIEVVIPSGTSSSGIAYILKEKKLIRNELVFKIYLVLHKHNSLKATTYNFKKSMSVNKIVSILEEGNTYNPDEVRITFKEGKRITDYAKEISSKMNHSYDEVINVFKNKDVKVEDVITTMLDQMEKNLEKYKETIKNNVHRAFTLASILELEGTTLENRKMIAGVFENRLKINMNLGSDVTTYYGLQVEMNRDLTTEEFNRENGYNTRYPTMRGKLPVGPICNFSMSSLEASIYPTDSDYLYFVADKNGKIYYTKTMREHEEKVAKIKKNGDWIW